MEKQLEQALKLIDLSDGNENSYTYQLLIRADEKLNYILDESNSTYLSPNNVNIIKTLQQNILAKIKRDDIDDDNNSDKENSNVKKKKKIDAIKKLVVFKNIIKRSKNNNLKDYTTAKNIVDMMTNGFNEYNDIFDVIGIQKKKLCDEFDISNSSKINVGTDKTNAFYFDDPELNDLIIKEVPLRTKDFRYHKVDDDQNIIALPPYLSEIIIASLLSLLGDAKNTSYNRAFLPYDGFFICPKKTKRGEVQYDYIGHIISTRLGATFRTYAKDEKIVITANIIQSMLFQVFFAIKTAQKQYNFVHHDLHPGNIGITFVNPKLKIVWLEFDWEGVVFRLPNLGFVIRMFDFDLSLVAQKTKVTSYMVYADAFPEWTGIDESFKPGYDVAYVMNNMLNSLIINRYNLTIDEISSTAKFMSKLTTNAYSLMNIKRKLGQEFREFFNQDPDSADMRPNEFISSENLTDLLFTDSFDMYRNIKPGKRERVFSIAKIKK